MKTEGKEVARSERGLEGATAPHNPGSGYVLDWEDFACNAVPDLLQQGPDGQRYGWARQYVNPSPITGENNFRVACSPAEPVRNGGRSARFQLNLGDPVPGTTARTRSELSMMPDEPLEAGGVTERRYSFSIYLDSPWKIDSKSSEILTQWHQSDASTDPKFGGTPPLAIVTRGENWLIALRDEKWDNNQKNDIRVLSSVSLKNDIGKWTDWVVHVKWSEDPTKGVIEIWKNGNQLTLGANGEKAFRGQNKFADGRGNYMKFGIYKWDWTRCDDPNAHIAPADCKNSPYLGGFDQGVDKRVIYYDDLRVTASAPAPTSRWSSLGGTATSDPGAVLQTRGRLVVFVRGTDNAIWHRWQVTTNGDWSGWASVGAPPGGATSGPDTALNAPGGLVVFARGADNAIWHCWQGQPDGNWSG